MNVSTIGSRLLELRLAKGVRQQDVALAIHVQRNLISYWEDNERPIRSDSIVALADYFGVTADWIIRGVKAENVAIHKATGLSDDAVNALQTIRTEALEKDSQTGYKSEHASRLASALSKALASKSFLLCLAEYMSIEPRETGFHYSTVGAVKTDKFVLLEASPDAYAAMLATKLSFVLEDIRKNRTEEEQAYPPFEQEIHKTIEELETQERIVKQLEEKNNDGT